MGDKTIVDEIYIGARGLKEHEVNRIVPSYGNVGKNIKKFRNIAKIDSKKNKNKFYQSSYNNIITFLGKRGSGKTSILITLAEELEKNEDDYIVGFIKPDDLNQSTTIQGCIIDYFKAIKEEIINEYQEWERKHDKCKDDCVARIENAYKELLKSYIYTDPSYKEAIVNNYSDLNSYIDKSSLLLNAEANVERNLINFVNELSELHKKNKVNKTNRRYKEINIKKQDGFEELNREPLFFVFFDDVDLNTIKCRDIVNAILKYATHPNIVVIVSGEFSTFVQALTHSMLIDEKAYIMNIDPLSEIPYSDNSDNGYQIARDSLYNCKEKLAYDYLRKIFPPAYRNYVVTWSPEQRANYSFGSNTDKTLIKMIYEKIGELISDKKNNELSMFGYLEKVKNENDQEESNIKYIIFERSFELFDITSRGLVDIFYTLSSIDEEMKSKEKHSINVIKNIIESIVYSNTELKDYGDTILSKMIIFGKEWKDCNIVVNLIENDELLSDESIKFKLLLLCNFALECFVLDDKSYNDIHDELFRLGLNKSIFDGKSSSYKVSVDLWNEINYNIKPFNNYNYCNLIYFSMAEYYNDKTNFVLNDFKEYNYSLNFHRIMLQCFLDLNEKGFSLEYDNYYYQETFVKESLKNTRDNIIKNMNIVNVFNRGNMNFIYNIYNKLIDFYEFRYNSDINLSNYPDLLYVMGFYISSNSDEQLTQDSADIKSQCMEFINSFYNYISRGNFYKYESEIDSILRIQFTPDDFITVFNSDKKAISKKISLGTITKIRRCKTFIAKALLINELHEEDFIHFDLDDIELDDEIDERIVEEHLVLFCYYSIFDCFEYKKEYSLFKEVYKKFSNNVLNSK